MITEKNLLVWNNSQKRTKMVQRVYELKSIFDFKSNLNQI